MKETENTKLECEPYNWYIDAGIIIGVVLVIAFIFWK